MKAKEPDPFPGLKQKELYMALPLEFDKAKWDEISLEEHLQNYVNQGMDRKEAMKAVAKDRNISKREVYDYLIK